MNKKGFLLFTLLIGLFWGNLPNYADNGKLTINNQVIYEKNKEKEDSIEYQIAPDLFLEKKTKLNQEQLQQQEQRIKTTQERLFSGYRLPETSSTSFEYGNQLFLGDYQETVVHLTSGKQRNKGIPVWLWRLFSGGIISGMLVIGILLGRKFSKVFVKKGGAAVE